MRHATAGLCFGFAKRSVRFADSLCSITAAWPSRKLSHQRANCRRRRFGPAGPRLLRHRDPEPVGVCRSVLVESSPLHSGGRRMSERMKAPSASSRPPVSTGGSARMIRLFQACVNFFCTPIIMPSYRQLFGGMYKAPPLGLGRTSTLGEPFHHVAESRQLSILKQLIERSLVLVNWCRQSRRRQCRERRDTDSQGG